MAKNPASETITHKFFSDGSPTDKCKKCESYKHEDGHKVCTKLGKFSPTIAYGCFKRDTNK